MFYQPFDRSMGLWIINEFLNSEKLDASHPKDLKGLYSSAVY